MIMLKDIKVGIEVTINGQRGVVKEQLPNDGAVTKVLMDRGLVKYYNTKEVSKDGIRATDTK